MGKCIKNLIVEEITRNRLPYLNKQALEHLLIRSRCYQNIVVPNSLLLTEIIFSNTMKYLM